MKRFSARTVSWYSIVLEGLFIVVVYAFLYVNVQSIERMVGESREAHLPSIQEGQRTLLNLEYLRHSVSQLRQAPNEEYLRSTYTGIRVLLAEISFDKRVDEITLRDLGTPIRELYDSRNRVVQLYSQLLESVHTFLAGYARAGGSLPAEAVAALWQNCVNLTENSAAELRERIQQLADGVSATGRSVIAPLAQRIMGIMDSLRQEDLLSRKLNGNILERITSFRVAASSSEVKLIYSELSAISRHAERIQQVALHLCIGLTCCLGILSWLLHHHILLPIMQASDVLSNILNGRAVERYPSSRIRELDSMIQALPLLQRDMLAKDARSSRLEKGQEQLKSMSFRDSLTGLSNRRALDLLLKGGVPDECVAILMFDIDLFKQYNDTLGHLAGDEALRRVGEIAMSYADANCTPFRYGGEEFVMIFQGEGALPDKVRAVARDLMARLASADIPHPASPWGRLTVSVGLAFRAPGLTSLHETLDQADKALYRAKSRGRHRVEELEDPTPESGPVLKEA